MKKLPLLLLIAFLPVFCYGQFEIKTKPLSFVVQRPNIAVEVYLLDRLGLEYEFIQTYQHGILLGSEGAELFKGQKNRVSAKYYIETAKSFQFHMGLYGGGKIVKRYPSPKDVEYIPGAVFGENYNYRLTQLMLGAVTGLKWTTHGLFKGIIELQFGGGIPFNTKFNNNTFTNNPPNHDAYAGLRFGFSIGNKSLFQKEEEEDSSKTILYRQSSK